jgi:3'-phosphoadenosine 5'-phosphosulfate sulfotransferase (PAPS reductase)/FAD synthetase
MSAHGIACVVLPVQDRGMDDLPSNRLFERDPDDIVHRAKTEHDPVATFALVSGGGDSSAMLYRCREHIDAAIYIDTGTALPGVEEHAVAVCEQLGVPLRIYRTPPSEYEAMVMHHGFPGKAQHGRAYIRLKERQIEKVRNDAKRGHKRSRRVLLLSGARAEESIRRMGTTVDVRKVKGKAVVWANPLIDWSNDAARMYRDGWYTPSDVQLLTHRSGECNCGAFADDGERKMLAGLSPEWWERIGALEVRAERAGVTWCRWGETPGDAIAEDLPMCASCPSRQLAMPVVSADESERGRRTTAMGGDAKP